MYSSLSGVGSGRVLSGAGRGRALSGSGSGRQFGMKCQARNLISQLSVLYFQSDALLAAYGQNLQVLICTVFTQTHIEFM